MAIVFDPAKSARNLRDRGLSFDRAEDFDFANAYMRIDDRKDYGEVRIRALGFLDDRLHLLVFTERGNDLRVISFRRAKRTERKLYEENKARYPG
jgi:uncharacterized DUF497 family protein